MTHHVVLVLLAMLAAPLLGCSGSSVASASFSPAAPADERNALPAAGAFVGKIWVSASRAHDPGSIVVFLRNGSMLIDGCSKSLEVTRWGVANGHIRWLEDVVPIEVKVVGAGASTLKLQEVGTNEERYFVAASPPYKCPAGHA